MWGYGLRGLCSVAAERKAKCTRLRNFVVQTLKGGSSLWPRSPSFRPARTVVFTTIITWIFVRFANNGSLSVTLFLYVSVHILFRSSSSCDSPSSTFSVSSRSGHVLHDTAIHSPLSLIRSKLRTILLISDTSNVLLASCNVYSQPCHTYISDHSGET